MAGAVLGTKFYRPRPRHNLVPRARLLVRFGSDARLTLISAPAGFGKSTVLAAWLASAESMGDAVAWLSLGERDSEPTTFWTYVVTALRSAAPEVGADALALLESAQAPIESVLTTLLNDLAGLTSDIDLVLDDYHLVDGPALQQGMTFLLENLPANVHFVISTRADPALPLARLRARGELVEIRAADLRFTAEEIEDYLNGSAGLHLAANELSVLEGRTEGWIAALQLAALSLQGRDDTAGFVARFAGDDRFIVDYLVEEVLRRQSEDARRFLLQTSIVERMNARLCDAITGRRDGKAMLEALDRGNLFLVALDDNRGWYRYHHLFGEVLRAHLADERSDEVVQLQARASRWYAEANDSPAAIRHALAAGDAAGAADLVELALPGLRTTRQEATIRSYLDVIPAALVDDRPVLAIGFIGALMARGEFDIVVTRLDAVERLLESPGAPLVAADPSQLPRLPGAIATYRAGLALIRGDVEEVIRQAQLAIARAVPDDDEVRSAAAALEGLACWAMGDLEAALRGYSVCIDGLTRIGHVGDVLGCSIAVADIRIAQGRLRDAQRSFEHGLRLAADVGGPALRGTPDMHVGLSRIATERAEYDVAQQHLQRVAELGEHNGLPQNAYRWRVAKAELSIAGGDVDGALALLEEAERLYVGDFSPDVRPVPAMRARLLAATGRVDEAFAWAAREGLSAADELSYLREYEHVTLARVLLAQANAQRSTAPAHEAAQLLARLLAAAELGGRGGTVLEIHALRALAFDALGEAARAQVELDRALTLAEPDGWCRVLVGEGRPMAALLRATPSTRGVASHRKRVLDAFGPATVPRTPAQRGGGQGVVDPLSERELVVLRLLASDLDGPDIARQLVVSVNTLRTHTKNIYAKLGVNSRREAVTRAGELHLLDR